MFSFLRKKQIIVFEKKEKSLKEIILDFHSFYSENADTIHGLAYPNRSYIPAFKDVNFNQNISIDSTRLINMDLSLSERGVSLILTFKEANFLKELVNVKFSKYYSINRYDVDRYDSVKEFENGPFKIFMKERITMFQEELEKTVKEKNKKVEEVLFKSFSR